MAEGTSRVKQTQTRNPAASLAQKNLDPTKRRIAIQISEPGRYKSPLLKYLDAESPTRPGEPMCKIVADGRLQGDGEEARLARTLAGGEDMVLVEISVEDSEYVRKHGHPAFAVDGNPTGWADALAAEKRVARSEKKKFEGGAVEVAGEKVSFQGGEGETFESVEGGVLAAT